MSSRDDYERLKKLSDFIRGEGEMLRAAIENAAEAGIEIREFDVAFLKNRVTQIADAVERKAGSFLPPITGTLNVQLDAAKVE